MSESSRSCSRCPRSESMPGLTNAVSQRVVRYQSAAAIHKHPSAHGHQLSRAAREGEDRGGVRVPDWGRTRNVDPERGEIGVLANFEGSDSRIDSKRAGAANRCELQRLVRTECVVPAGGGAMNEDGETLSLIHISEPTRLGMISYAVF